MTRYDFRTFVFILLAVAGLASPARATTYDLDFTGTISSNSVDALGLFGKAGKSLTGDSFTVNFTYSVPSAVISTLSSLGYQDAEVQPVTYSLTINNKTVTPASFGPITVGAINAESVQGTSSNGDISAFVANAKGRTGRPRHRCHFVIVGGGFFGAERHSTEFAVTGCLHSAPQAGSGRFV